MNTTKSFYLFVLINVCRKNRVSNAAGDETWMKANNVYEFSVKDLQGNDVPMSNYRNKILFIFNIEPECKLIEQNYKYFNALHDKYSSKGLVILAFPCDQFGKWISNTNEEIYQFAINKNVKFSIFDKVNVNGDKASPLWKYLKSQKKFWKIKKDITCNYTKFIVDRNGKVVDRISPFNLMNIDRYLKPYFNQEKSNDKKNRK